uniref:Secreted protein n=1 Tax=Romanomermis culicivorax TaxID=13658 RepID=A0A915IKZ9_ROMCU
MVTTLTIRQAVTAWALLSISQHASGAMPTNLICTTPKIASGSNVKMLREIKVMTKGASHMPGNL